MTSFILRRVLAGFVVPLGISIITFLVAFIVPGDPARLIAGPHAGRAALENIRHVYGMDQPLLVQYLRYMSHLLRGNLGYGYSISQAVLPAILAHLWATVILAMSGALLELAIGVPVGVMAAVWVQGIPDRLGIFLVLVGFSMPPFVLGNLLLLLFAYHWSLFPLGGSDGVKSLILPALTLGICGAAWYARLLRATLLDILHMPYMRTALAKGLSSRQVIVKHGLRNAVGPLVSQFGLDLSYFLGGVVVVEVVFAWPGIGQLAFDGIIDNDINVVMGTVLFAAVCVVIVNILVDIGNAMLDPRIRLS